MVIRRIERGKQVMSRHDVCVDRWNLGV